MSSKYHTPAIFKMRGCQNLFECWFHNWSKNMCAVCYLFCRLLSRKFACCFGSCISLKCAVSMLRVVQSYEGLPHMCRHKIDENKYCSLPSRANYDVFILTLVFYNKAYFTDWLFMTFNKMFEMSFYPENILCSVLRMRKLFIEITFHLIGVSEISFMKRGLPFLKILKCVILRSIYGSGTSKGLGRCFFFYFEIVPVWIDLT